MTKIQDEFSPFIRNIRIVLVSTTHPGNIGATARAMKTMGLCGLALVQPKIFPSAEVTARAAGADDILAAVNVYPSLDKAISDCNAIYATSARSRNIQWPVVDPYQAACEIVEKAGRGEKTAILFGRESSGLSNKELELCNTMIQIPSNEAYSSLNVASAVQIICYEIRKIMLRQSGPESPAEKQTTIVDNAQMARFYQHLEQCLGDIGYYDPENPRLLMRRLKRLFNRSQLEEEEYNILRGIFAAAQQAAKRKQD